MIPLVIDGEKIKAIREYAEANPIRLYELHEIIEGIVPTVGDREGHVCFLDFGFKLVFSIEEHPRSDGGTMWGRHISVSLTEPTGTRVPNINSVKLLCMELGFKPMEQCMLRFVEEADPKYVEVFCETDL